VATFGHRKLKTFLYCRKYCDILNRLGVTHESWGQTHRQTCR